MEEEGDEVEFSALKPHDLIHYCDDWMESAIVVISGPELSSITAIELERFKGDIYPDQMYRDITYVDNPEGRWFLIDSNISSARITQLIKECKDEL